MKFSAIAFAGAALALALPLQVEAATVVITYQGIVDSGFDITGVFGQAGQDLTGLSYTSVYTLTEPTTGAIVNNDGTTGSTYGGTNYGVASPLSATLTINGVTKSVAGSYIGIAQQVDGLPSLNDFDLVFHEAQDQTNTPIEESNNLIYDVIRSDVYSFVNSSNYLDSLTYSVQAGDTASGAFLFYSSDLLNGVTPVYAAGSLTPQTVNIAAFSPSTTVPEPETWAMMIAGFGLLGVATRRRRNASVRIRYSFA
jgi:PEP-CTERM motif